MTPTPPQKETTAEPGSVVSRLLGLFKHQVAVNVGTVFSGRMAGRLVTLLTTWVLVRNLAPEEYGVFSVIDMIVGSTTGFLTEGLNRGMVKLVSENREEPWKAWYIAKAVFKVELVYGLILAGALYLGAEAMAVHYFRKPHLAPFLKVASVGIIGFLLYFYRNALFSAWKRFRMDAVYNTVQPCLYLAFVLALLAFGWFGIRVVTWGYVGVPFLVTVFALFQLGRGADPSRGRKLPGIWSQLTRTYAWLLGYHVCLWITNQAHMLILGRYFPLHQVGLYGFAYKLYLVSTMIADATKVVLLPTFAGQTRAQTKEVFIRTTKAVCLVGLLFWMAIPLVGPVLRLVVGEEYAGTVPILQVLLFGTGLFTAMAPASVVLLGYGRFKTLLSGGIIFVAVNLVGHWLVTIRYGAMGAAWVQVGSSFVCDAVLTVFAVKLLFGRGERERR